MLSSPKDISTYLFNELFQRVEGKRKLIDHMHQSKALLHITRQDDLPGEVRIEVDYPTEWQAKKNHYLVRIVVPLNGDKINLSLAPSFELKEYPIDEYIRVLHDSARIITTY